MCVKRPRCARWSHWGEVARLRTGMATSSECGLGETWLSIFVEARQEVDLGGLRLPTTSWCHVSSSSTGCEAAATSILRETTTSLAARATVRTSTTTSHPTSVLAVASAISSWTWAPLFDVDLLTPDGVRIGGDSSIVARSIGKFDKGTVLSCHQSVLSNFLRSDGGTNLLSAHVKVREFSVLK